MSDTTTQHSVLHWRYNGKCWSVVLLLSTSQSQQLHTLMNLRLRGLIVAALLHGPHN